MIKIEAKSRLQAAEMDLATAQKVCTNIERAIDKIYPMDWTPAKDDGFGPPTMYVSKSSYLPIKFDSSPLDSMLTQAGFTKITTKNGIVGWDKKVGRQKVSVVIRQDERIQVTVS